MHSAPSMDDAHQTPTLIPPMETLTLDDSDHPFLSSSASFSPTPTNSDPLSRFTLFTNPSDLCIDLDSLHDLASRGQWLSVLDKVARARSLSLLTQPHHHLVYLAFNLLSLFKLRRYPDAAEELHILTIDDDLGLDSPRFRYESYPQIYQGRSGSMLPFAVRYIHAELPQRLGDRQATLDRLYLLLDFVRAKAGSSQWKRREKFVISSLCCNHFCQKEYDVCLLLIEELIQREGANPFLLSRLGYVQMQMGDLEGCSSTFACVEEMRKEGGDGGNDVVLDNLVRRNRALEFVLAKEYASAVREYDECIEKDPADVAAINNKALCLMYSRDLSDSIKVLEGALERVPTAAVNEMLVVNLCSMYELAYVNHGEVKKNLNTWIARVAPDDFDSTCTRI